MVAVAERRSRVNAHKGKSGASSSSARNVFKWFRWASSTHSNNGAGGDPDNANNKYKTTKPTPVKTTNCSSKQETLKKIVVTPPKNKTVSTSSRLIDFATQSVTAASLLPTKNRSRIVRKTPAASAKATSEILQTPLKKQHITKHSVQRHNNNNNKKATISTKTTTVPSKSTPSAEGSVFLAVSHALQDELQSYLQKHRLTKEERRELSAWNQACQDRLQQCDQHFQKTHEQDTAKITDEMKNIQQEIDRLKQECMDMDIRAEASRFLYRMDEFR